jgi:uncharacterized protein (DUF983 family)
MKWKQEYEKLALGFFTICLVGAPILAILLILLNIPYTTLSNLLTLAFLLNFPIFVIIYLTSINYIKNDMISGVVSLVGCGITYWIFEMVI